MAYSLSISITQNSQSVANNTSNVTVKVNCSWTYGTWSAENLEKYVTINGTKYSFSSTDINPNATTSGSSTLYTKTLDIAHNADGTGKVDVYALTRTTNSSGTQTASASKTLTTIARKSSVSATNEYIENNCLITISRKSSSFTHTLKYTFGSLSGTIATKTSSTNVNFLLPQTFYAQLGSTGTQKSGTITCETFNGSTSLGTTSCSFTAYANKQNCNPTLHGASVVLDSKTMGLTGRKDTIIKYFTDATVTIGAAARLSATLKEKSVTNGGKKLTSDGTFTSVTEGDFTFYAKDSRGYTATYTETFNVIPYIKLTCNADARLGVDGTLTVRIFGNYFNDTFGASNNTLTPQFRYKYQGGEYSSWRYCPPSLDGDTYIAEGEEWGLDADTIYIVEARAVDAMGIVTTQEYEVKAEPIFDWGENDFNFNVPTKYKGNRMMYSSGESIIFDGSLFSFSGYISDSTKRLYFQIPLMKPIFANSVTFSGTVIGRGINGYVNGTSWADSTAIHLAGTDDYTVSYEITDFGIGVAITFNTAITNATNNTPVAISPYGRFSITFI